MGHSDAWRLEQGYDEALADYETALGLDRTFAEAFNSHLVMGGCPDATHRDGRNAIDSAAQACELSEWKNAMHIATLAAAYAELGDFDQAVHFAKRGLASRPIQAQ